MEGQMRNWCEDRLTRAVMKHGMVNLAKDQPDFFERKQRIYLLICVPWKKLSTRDIQRLEGPKVMQCFYR